MHIEVRRESDKIIISFVNPDPDILTDEKLKELRFTLQEKYGGDFKEVFDTKLFVNDVRGFQDKVHTYEILSLCNYKLTEEDKLKIIGQEPTQKDFSEMFVTLSPISNYHDSVYSLYEDYYSNLTKTRVTHGRRFQRLRQKQWFKKK